MWQRVTWLPSVFLVWSITWWNSRSSWLVHINLCYWEQNKKYVWCNYRHNYTQKTLSVIWKETYILKVQHILQTSNTSCPDMRHLNKMGVLKIGINNETTFHTVLIDVIFNRCSRSNICVSTKCKRNNICISKQCYDIRVVGAGG